MLVLRPTRCKLGRYKCLCENQEVLFIWLVCVRVLFLRCELWGRDGMGGKNSPFCGLIAVRHIELWNSFLTRNLTVIHENLYPEIVIMDDNTDYQIWLQKCPAKSVSTHALDLSLNTWTARWRFVEHGLRRQAKLNYTAKFTRRFRIDLFWASLSITLHMHCIAYHNRTQVIFCYVSEF